MKKFFTLIAALVLCVAANAAKSEISLTGWGWGWSSEVSNDDGNLIVTITGNNGAGSTGWSNGTDWSAYTRLVAVVESAVVPEGGYGQIQAKYKDAEGTEKYLTGSITSSDAQQVVTVNFDDPSALTNVAQLWIQGSEGAAFIVSSIYLENDEAEPTETAIDITKINGVVDNGDGTYTYTSASAWGWDNIWYGGLDASNYDFIGVELAEATDVNFQVVVEYSDNTSTNLWVSAGSTSAKADLDATLKSNISQIAFQTSAAGTAKITKLYWGKNATTGINAVKANKAATSNVYYNLSGQKVSKPSKGLYICNGKKVIVK